MRIGSNPEKFNKDITNHAYHRIVIPVYIPNFEGYFKDAFEIFKLNVESLLKTVHSKTRITIYNNNCIEEVKIYIDNLYSQYTLIDQVFHSKENLGKINAILSSVKGNLEPLITITDSDVFFKHNWQSEVESVFLNFPNAGMVSPVPSSKAFKTFTDNNWFFGIFKGKIRFEAVQNPMDMQRFDDSLGDQVQLYQLIHLEKYLVLNSKGNKAVMGCGHFAVTMRREVFDKGSNSPAFIKIQGGVENKFIDAPNEALGYLRLATLNNFAYHLGNVTEKWMFDEFEQLSKQEANLPLEDNRLFSSKQLNKFQTFLGKISKELLLHKYCKEKYFKRIGLKNGKNY